MRRYFGILAALFVLAPAASVGAQPPGYGGSGYGIGFSYRGGRFSVSGYFGGRSAYYAEPYEPYLYGPAIIQQRVIKVYKPVLVVPVEPAYDTRGVDLDLIHPPTRIGPDEKKKEQPPAKLPGEDVSKPKDPLRPEDLKGPPQPPPQPEPPAKVPGVGGPDRLPKPLPPLPDGRAEADRQIARGVAEFQDQQFGLAAQRFHQATLLDPDHALAHFLLAQAQYALGYYDEAVASIHEGMKRRLDWPDAKFRPRFQLYRGNEALFDEHLARLDEAVKQNPQSAVILFLAAHQRWFDGNRMDAVPLLQRARPLAPDTAFIDRFLDSLQPKIVVNN